jgi:Type IV secretion system pilin
MNMFLRVMAGFPWVPHAVAQCPSGNRYCLWVATGFNGALPDLILRVVYFLSYLIGTICTVTFIVGGLVIVLSRGQDSGALSISRGKSLIVDSLIGLGVVLGAQGILRVVMYIIYAPA